MANKRWIKGAIKHPGALTRKAKASGKTVAQYIEKPPKDITASTRKQITLAKTLRKIRGGKK